MHLLVFWKPSSLDLEVSIPVTQHLKCNLQWWLNPVNTIKGKSLQPIHTDVTITIDASQWGLGGHLGRHYFRGQWSDSQQRLHINCVELEAVFLTLKHFLLLVKDKNVLIRCDNTSVVQHISKQGEQNLLNCATEHGIYGTCHSKQHSFEGCSHIGGSEQTCRPVEQEKCYGNKMVSPQVILYQIFQTWGFPLINLFALAENCQIQIFLMDSTSRSFNTICPVNFMGKMFRYAYPPIYLIPKVLPNITQFHCQIILIAPRWFCRHWFKQLLQLLVACPRKLLTGQTNCFKTKHSYIT